ncbi:MAG: endonuclease domain-containing protein [Hyphomonadaceae bacterium]|nr:endonuclease domain-containing protein [Hyphomonadaceae bacterium]
MRTDLPDENSSAHFKSERAVVAARRLRQAMTKAECALWVELRRLPLKGTHFRRQAPFGPFIADFLCHKARLIVEVDGGAHEAISVASRDVERQQWIENRGYRMLRFTNAEVLADTLGVARIVFAETDARLR